MAEGQRFSERKSRLQDFKAGLQGDQGAGTQQTQQTQQDTSGQQATGGIFLPGINTDYSSTLPKTGYQGALESGKIQSNVVLPGITDKPKIENAILDTATIEQQRRANVRARNNVSDQQSWNEKIEDEMYKSQTIPVIQQGIKQGWNDIKKRTYRYGLDFIENPYSYLSKMYPTGIAERLLFNNKSLVSQKKLDEMRKNYDKYSNKLDESFNKWVDNNINQTVANKYAEKGLWNSFKEGDWKNFDYGMKQAFSTSVIPMLPGIVAGFITKNPAVLAGVGYLPAEAVENQEAYDEALKLGATREQAEMIGNTAGKINGVLEIIGEIFQLKGILKPVKKGITDEVVKYTMKSGNQIIRRALLNLGRGTLGEGTTEAMQEIVTNSLLSMLDNRDIMQGVLDSFLAGFFMGAPSSTLSSVGGAIQDQENNKKIEQQADIEALNYIMEGEERKAQRMQQAKERMKQRFLNPTLDNGYTPTEEEAQQRANENEERENFEEELRQKQNEEATIQMEMEREVLSEGDLNEDLGDPRFQKTEATDTNEINKDLKDIKDSLEKMDDNTFFNRIMASINKGGKRNFVVFNKNGQKSVLRVMETKSKGKGSKGKTVTVQVMQPSKKSGNVIMSQFTYNPGNLSLEQKQGIITGFENWGKTGKFIDNTSNNEKYQLKYEEKDYNPGVANKNEKNISGKEGVKQRNKINDETIEQLAKKYGVKVEVIKGLVKVLKNGKWTGGYAYGKYLDQVLTLSEQIKESTAPHELLHAIFDMIDPETKAYLISQVMKSEGWSAKKAEEWLADSFSNFFRTGKIEGAPKSTWGKIKIFFKRVRSFINGLGRWRSELEEIFSDIITSEGIEELQGRIDQNQRLQEAKARMKKRFMEYAKNAEKMQKKAESKTKSQEKYQNTGKNEENDYTNSGQRSDPGIAGKISVLDAPFSFNTRTIQYNGEDITHTYDPKNSFLTDYTFNVPQELQQYVDLFNRAIENGYESAIIGEFDGRYIKIYFNDNFKEHFVKHGGFAPENLIMTLNRFDAFAQKVVDGKKRFVFEKQLPNGNYLVAITSTNLTEISFYESKKSKIGVGFEHFQLAGDINSKEFKKRFGDSKVIDDEGNPLVVYHGTNQKFSTFGDIKTKPGYRFTTDKEYANEYGKNLMKVYLKIENPLYIEDENKVEKILKGAFGKDAKWSDENILSDKFRDEAIKQGYDGIVFEHSGENTYIAFKPNQIKSATDNVGTYDPNNDDIRYQTVYHGSPAEFDKFDSSHMGEGEGAQAHGRGHYVAVNEQTGRHYAEMANDRNPKVKFEGKNFSNLRDELMGNPIRRRDPKKQVALEIMDYVERGVSFDEAVETVKRWTEDALDRYERDYKETQSLFDNESIASAKDRLKVLENISKDDFELFDRRRNLYEVEIPDPIKKDTPTGSNYLEEDGNITLEQNQKILKEVLKQKYGKYDLKNLKPITELTEGNIDNIIDKVKKTDDNLAYTLELEKNTSKRRFQTSFFTLGEIFERQIHGRLRGDDFVKLFVEEGFRPSEFDDLGAKSSKINAKDGRELYENLKYLLGNDEEASKFLESLGYDGIHYFGGRDGEAYVIFNDDALEITNHEKYQEAPSDQKDNDGRTLSNGQAEYFKDSKVRDKKGNLLRVYHGTRGKFTVFNRELSDFSSNSLAKIGNRFTESKEGANNWATDEIWGRGDPRVMEGYLNIKNPKVYAPKDITKDLEDAEFIRDGFIDSAKDVLRKIGELSENGDISSGFGDNNISYYYRGKLEEFSKLSDKRQFDQHSQYTWTTNHGYISKLKEKGYSDEKIIRLGEKAKNALEGYDEAKDQIYEIKNGADSYEQFENDVNISAGKQYAKKRTGGDWLMNMQDLGDKIKVKAYLDNLKEKGYDGIIIKGTDYDTRTMGEGNTQYVVFNSNQFKNIDNLNPTENEDIRYQTVYHGSQAEFDRFDSSHMGEGEGAQAHGWGHYVAVDPKTARHYAELRRYDNEVVIKGKKITNPEDLWQVPYFERTLYEDIFSKFAMGYNDLTEESFNEIIERRRRDYEMTIEYLQNLIDNPGKSLVGMEDVNEDYITEERKKQIQGYKDALEKLDELEISDIEVNKSGVKRNLYEVEIPDPIKKDTPTGKNYLEENGEITKSQMDKIYDEVVKEYEKKKQGKAKRVQNLQDGRLKTFRNLIDEAPGMLSDGKGLYSTLSNVLGGQEQASKFLESLGYDGIHYYGGRDGEAYVIFNDNDLEITNHEKYQKVEYDYSDDGKLKWIKYDEDNNERDPSIFGTPTREEQIEEDKENEKGNVFYDAWIKYNNQNFKDDQLTFDEFIQGISERADNAQKEYDQKMRDLSEAQNDPKLLDLQLRAVKLMEEEGKVGKKFGKNVSKEVRDRQQAEVEKKREQLIQDIVDYMYPGLKTEEITYDMQKEADQKEAEWEMLGREGIEEKLKYFKKDKNGNWEAKEVKIENPQIKLDKLLSAGKFDEIFTPVDRVLEWKTPQGQKGILDNQKDPKKYKSVLEKINKGTTKTKVTLKDVTRDYRALEKVRAEQEAEKERRKRERQEEFAKKKQEEYKKLVRMSAFQRLIDMQRLEKYPFLSENEIKERYGFTDEEWKKITEQEEIKLPKKWGDKARSDFNKAVDSYVRDLIKGLDWQNKMKQREAEKNLGEIGEIDVDVLLGRDEEKGQKEVEEFEKLAKEKREEKKLKIEDVKIDEEREQNKEEKAKVDKLIKSTKSDKTVRGSIKEITSNILTPVSTKIREISPKIHRELMRYFQNKDIITNERLKEAEPFLQAMKKIRKENPVRFVDIWVNLANRNIGYANGLLKEYGVTVPTELLDKIYLESQDVGVNMNYLGSYYPLSVKAPRSFLEELMKVDKGDIASEIDKRIMAESQKKGGPLEEAEITAIINSVIAGEENGPDINIGNKHMKKRNTEIKRTAKMLEYCDDPISTLISYIEGMTQTIERAKFLGKSRSGNVHTLADYVYNAKNGLTPDQQDELMDLLKAVFNDKSPRKAIQAWRDIATLTTLGSPSSTLTQLGDLSFSVYENGWRETLKAVWDVWMGRKAFDLIDMGVLNRGEEYTNINSQKNLLQKAIHNVFKLTFFSTFDTFGKSTYIQSTWNKWTRMARKGDKQLRKDIMKWTDDEYMTDKIIKDLSENNFSQDVALLMYMKLSNIQPLTKAQMPKAYLNNPDYGRLLYQFKTFGIKQLDYVLQETREQTKNFKNLSTGEKLLKIAQIANMVFVMTLLGVGADELKDITMRRRNNSLILRWLFGDGVGTEQIWEKMEDNVLKLFGLSRYTVMQMKSDPVDAWTNLFTTLPATNIINYPFKDIRKAFKDDGSINWRNPASYQLIPVIGKYRYWIYGGGQDKQQEALDKEKKKGSSKNKKGKVKL